MVDSGKLYHKKCTGLALDTVQRHEAPEDITLFGSCFCPFVQRVWVAFEFLGIPYKTVNLVLLASSLAKISHYADSNAITDEVDPYKKPQDLLAVSPKGLVPGLKLHNYNPPRALNESTVILEFLEECVESELLLHLLVSDRYLQPCSFYYETQPSAVFEPPLYVSFGNILVLHNPNLDARALVRLQSDHINRNLVPAFYRFLQAQEISAQIEGGKELHTAIEGLIALFERAERDVLNGGGVAGEGELRALKKGLGLWVDGGELGLADVMAGPWLFRANTVLKHYRGFALPSGPKTDAYFERLFTHAAFKATCSTEELYIDSYERYAFNRPNTSQVANAINSGRGLP
ncbi:hypothetical protein H0H92_005309 [Tricholoma furcatifolium]|nr:hypothetical protein H0H92_005309 [Tricholoma furcatifolium]